MILGIDPKIDYAFKHFLERDEMKAILIDLLNKVLSLVPGERLEEVELLNPFNFKEALDDNLSIRDIKARDQKGRQFNVEMQMFAGCSYPKRMLYYVTRLHQRQMHEGVGYAQLKPTISASFVNNVLFPQVGDHHLRFKLLEPEHGFVLSNDIEFYILELPKFTKGAEPLDGKGLDIWLYFLHHVEKMDTEALPTALRQPLVFKALEDLKMLAQSDLERERYESRKKAQLDYDSGLADARSIGREEGRIEAKISVIHLCEQLLKRRATPTEQLAKRTLDELNHMAEALEQELLMRNGLDGTSTSTFSEATG